MKTKTQKKTDKTKIRHAQNLAEASRITGISRVSLTGYRKAGCGAFKANGGVDLIELESWMALNGRSAGKESTDLQAARIRLLTGQALRVERENEIRAGRMVDKDTVTTDAHSIMAMLFESLDRLFCCELPATLKGLDEIGIRSKCVEEIERLKGVLRERFATIGSDAPGSEQP